MKALRSGDGRVICNTIDYPDYSKLKHWASALIFLTHFRGNHVEAPLRRVLSPVPAVARVEQSGVNKIIN